MKRVGILGGGQLGLLLSQSIFRLGGTVVIYDPDPAAPACNQTAHAIHSGWTDLAALEKFFAQCDVVTYEFENVDSAWLHQLEQKRALLPSAHVLKTTQDRLIEKRFLRQYNFPHARFDVVQGVEQIPKQAASLGYPCVLKSVRGGYDGKGQFFLHNEEEAQSAMRQLGSDANSDYLGVLEEALDIAMEVSCIVARSRREEEIIFPVFQNIHKDHILDFTCFPAGIPEPVAQKVQEIALNVTRSLDVYGLLTTEFFLTKSATESSVKTGADGWHVLVNELAPRPHNSGHVTINACTLSQYDALARVLLDLPLAQPQNLAPGFYCMGNLLGDIWLAQGQEELNLSALADHPSVVDVVIYGKKEARSKRKMGHFVTYGDSPSAALESAKSFRKSLLNPAPTVA